MCGIELPIVSLHMLSEDIQHVNYIFMKNCTLSNYTPLVTF